MAKAASADALVEGSKAPAFKMMRDGGKPLSLADFKGRNLVLYFYPKDDTSGCTKEAIGFSEAIEEFAAADTAVVGVSKDTVASHDKFKAKHDLAVILASDPEGEVCEAYGVWKEKSMYGRKFMGIERSTFLIDGKGVIRAAWRGVKVPGHVDAVLKTLKSLD